VWINISEGWVSDFGAIGSRPGRRKLQKVQLERAVGRKGSWEGIRWEFLPNSKIMRKSRDKHIDTVLTLPECSSILPASGSPTVPLESEGHVCEFVAGPGVLLSWALDSKFKAFFWGLSMTNSRGYSGGFGLLPSALPKCLAASLFWSLTAELEWEWGCLPLGLPLPTGRWFPHFEIF
jgi:hypothetical protein